MDQRNGEKARKIQLSTEDFWILRDLQRKVVLANQKVDPSMVTPTKVASTTLKYFSKMSGKEGERAAQAIAAMINE
jgi:hypothetical protein